MTFMRLSKDLLVTIRQHRRATVLGFVAGAALWLAVGAMWPKSYGASAVVAVNPQQLSASAGDDIQHDRQHLLDLLHQAIERQNWSAVVTEFGLYPDLVADRGLPAAGAYLASQVDLGSSETSSPLSKSFTIRYVGTNRLLVTSVMDTIAEAFTGPVTRNIPSVPADDLYAPVSLPSASPIATRKPIHQSSQPAGALSKAAHSAFFDRQLQASQTQGAKLQDALNQIAVNLADLKNELKRNEAQAASRNTAPLPPKPVPSAADRSRLDEEGRLHQELARAQHDLNALRERYTDEYPEVVAAQEHVQDIVHDLARITALAVAKAPEPSATAKPSNTIPASSASGADPLIAGQISRAEAAQSRLQELIRQNQEQTSRLQAESAAASREMKSAPAAQITDMAPKAEEPAATGEMAHRQSGPAGPAASLFFLLQQPTVTVRPFFFAAQVLWPLSLVVGLLAAFFAAWVAERRDPSIRNEGMLRTELPASAVYLGGIPRIRHQVVAD